jgi:hypothetical protein
VRAGIEPVFDFGRTVMAGRLCRGALCAPILRPPPNQADGQPLRRRLAASRAIGRRIQPSATC